MIGHGELVAALAARAADGLPTVLTAPPGRGKSAILDAVAEPWVGREDHVVWLTAAPADRDVPFAALADLLSEAPELPGPWLEAVRRALRRIPGTPDRVAIRLAARACVEAAVPPTKRVLLLADDTQWWDPDSLDALAYLARHGIPVVAATRPGGPADFLGREAVELPIPPLTSDQTATLVQARGIGFRMAARVHAAAGGNARLTVEIARHLDGACGALDTMTTPAGARRCVRGWIDELPTPDGVWRSLLIAALAADPSVATLRRTAGPDTLEALSCAEQAGLIAVDAHGTVTFPATAVRDTVLADASQETLRTAHLLLAQNATDPTARLWHRASAARDRPDLELASELAVAARAVRRRGDPGRAAELWLLAAEIMPARDTEPDKGKGPRPTAASALLLAAATDAAAAGRSHLARTAVARLDRTESDHAARARARLAVVDAAGQAVGSLDDILDRALADAEAAADPALLSAVHLRISWHAHLALGDNRRAHDAARAAVRAAELSQNPETQATALVMLARLEQLLGEPSYPRVLRRALALSPDPTPGAMINSPRWLAVRFALFADQLDEARHHLRQLTSHAERSGSRTDRALVLRGAVEIDARAGHGADAMRAARRLEELPGTERASPGPMLFTSALAQLAGGTLEEALRLADHGSAASAQEQDQIFLTRCLALSGKVHLLLRDAAAAAEDLKRVRTLVAEQGIVDPASVRFHADLAEVLVALGQSAEAAAVVAEGRREAERLRRRGVLAALDRADAVLKAAQGDHARAEALLHRAETTFRTLGLPLERGRVLLTRSVIDKRRRRAASARLFHDQAEMLFQRAQAPLWEPAEAVETAPTPDLTAAEQRIVALVTEGLPNREIASSLFLSVKTVESVLTGVYRKLGVRSRTQLAVLLRDD